MSGEDGGDEGRRKLDLISEVMEEPCSSCGTGLALYDSCPYRSEIKGDVGECDCCERCRQQCLDDI